MNRLSVIWVWLLVLCAPAAIAQVSSPAPDGALVAEQADVRVIIDISGSMKQNDPENLRRPALDLLIKMIPEGSKAGVWTFGQYVNMLVPHREVNDQWRKDAAAKVQQVNSVGLFTNIGGALERANKDGGPPEPGFNTNIILLTDGMVDVSRNPEENAREWRRIVDEVLPSLKGQKVKIHTVALSDNADGELMNALSLGTDGVAAVANNASELTKIFMRALAQSAPADEVALDENKFLVDSSIEEFTALIFRAKPEQQTELLSPDQKFYKANTKDPYIAWHRASDHDLITIKQPIEGEWLVRADLDPDSKITIVTNLKLLVKPMANNLFEGQATELQFLLQDKGKTISDARFLRLLNIKAALLKGEQSLWAETLSDALPPGDGIYRRTLDQFEDEGRYLLRLNVDGKSFSREFTHHLAVRPPFQVERERQGNGDQLISVSANGQTLDKARTVVVAKVREPSGRSSIQPLVLSPTDQWELRLSPAEEGEYEIDLRVSAIDSEGAKFDHHPAPIAFTHPEGADPFKGEPKHAVAPAPTPESTPELQQEPTPEPTQASSQEPEAEPVANPEPAADTKKWVLYGALAVGNLLILGLAYFAWRMVMGGKKSEDDDLDEAGLEQEMAAEEQAQAAASDEPKLDDLTELPMADDLGDGAVDLESETAADELADIDVSDNAPEFTLDDLAPAKDDDPDESSDAGDDLPKP
ncbi:VWA domain-containing protein [Simiduia sp. 21SJ11W-1]|uniref:VWA domain-containing protein n=1 Tax=Simiduia sp. 21SJ11W-1 TaxID=2909669 RepID=UPI00209F9944|nr:VWA domain-containing protein [Simiduia sp. 21SJ11W-1]UTA48971.1 VWA domain-containing protein [Simiduia sp. 21SJ11W-1]